MKIKNDTNIFYKSNVIIDKNNLEVRKLKIELF